MSTRSRDGGSRTTEVIATTKDKVGKLVREAEQKIHDGFEETRLALSNAVNDAKLQAKQKTEGKLNELADMHNSAGNGPASRAATLLTTLNRSLDELSKNGNKIFEDLDSFCRTQDQELSAEVCSTFDPLYITPIAL
jgi:microcystin degradation protein MlrC